MIDYIKDVQRTPPSNSIMVIDPRRLSREALQQLLEAAFFRIVGEGRTLTEALQHLPSKEIPDLIIYNFDNYDQLTQVFSEITQARAKFGEVKSVILTDCTQPEMLLKAVQAGVEAILSKDISAGVLQRAIELVLLGQCLFPTGIAQALLQPAQRVSEKDIIASPPQVQHAPKRRRAVTLSKREYQILRCLVDGLPNKAIARDLDITEATVKVHVKGLLRKTQMANRTQAAIWGLNNSLWSELAAPGIGEDSWATGPEDVTAGMCRTRHEDRPNTPLPVLGAMELVGGTQ
jgi:two-component system nitrate/nitrite response regulator NarL